MGELSRKMLIVEDELLVRMCVADFAEDAGYRVIEAGDVESALAALAEHPDISALLTDVNLPGGRDGLDLARHVEAHCPAVRVIVASGKPIPTTAELSPDVRYLPKPYGAADFHDVVAKSCV